MTTKDERYSGDPDAYIEYPITDETGADVNWASPQVTATTYRGVSVTIACSWIGAAGPTRTLHVPVDDLPAGPHELRLIVPADNDIELGDVMMR